MPHFSIITVSYNSSAVITDCMRSVTSQTYPVEHIVIDGASKDNTLEIVRQLNPDARIVSEPDEGIYDAMNKGIRMATGEIIGILNSDDFYISQDVLEKVSNRIRECDADALFADLVYVRSNNLQRVVRYYSGAGFTPDKFAWGWMPPHPTFFVKREIYERYGMFRTNYKIAADYELTARFLAKHKIRYTYLPEVVVCMRTGGISTRNVRSNLILNWEILRACKENDINTNIFKVYSKYFRKVMQLVARPT